MTNLNWLSQMNPNIKFFFGHFNQFRMTKFKLVNHFKMVKVTSYLTQKVNLSYKKVK